MRFRTGSCLSVLVALLLTAPQAHGQVGTIAGQVRDAASGRPIAEATVQVRAAAGTPVASGVTASDGSFRIVNIRPGSYFVDVQKLGFAPGSARQVQVQAGETSELVLDLAATSITLDPTVITASRIAERAIESAQHVEVVESRDIEDRVTTSKAGHLQNVVGVDIAPIGLTSEVVTTRGFGNIFSGALFMLSDHRIAGVPSLRVNLMHMIPATNDDVESMEVMLGPGSAVYGPNTANGVLHILTRSPLTSQGTVVSLTGGERNLRVANFRTSQLIGEDFGVKVSGEFMRADEWPHVDPVEEQLGATRDLALERWSGEMRADWRITPSFTSVFSVGRSQLNNGIELTGIGAAQVRDWAYTYYQARATMGNFFGQVYLNTSDAGETFLLRTNEPIVDRSRLFVAQLQHGTALGTRQQFTYGIDFLNTLPNTEGTIHGRYENEDEVREVGAFLQSHTHLSDRLQLVAAARIDDHNLLENPVVSPRAALIFMPTRTQAFRFTYNRAFSTPRSLDFFLDIDAGAFPAPLGPFGYGLRAQGGGGTGFTFDQAGGYVMRSPFAPLGSTPQSRSAILSANVPTMWDISIGVLHAQGAFGAPGSAQAIGTAALLRSFAPSDADITRRTLDVLSGQRATLGDESFDVPVLEPSYTTSFEVGYQGIIGNRLRFAADVWTSTRNNFVSALRPVTPLLQLDSATTATFLKSRGMSAAQAEGIATGIAQLPVGVMTADNVSSAENRSDFLVTYRNFGRLSLWGTDFAAMLLLSDAWRVGANASWTSDDVFQTEGELLTLNAPARKFSASLGFMPDFGAHGEVRVRYNSAFPVLSAPYTATQCIPDADLPAGWQRPLTEEPCVESFTLGDVTLGYRFQRFTGAGIQLSVQNLFDTGYRSFPGAATMRRIAMARVRYEF